MCGSSMCSSEKKKEKDFIKVSGCLGDTEKAYKKGGCRVADRLSSRHVL